MSETSSSNGPLAAGSLKSKFVISPHSDAKLVADQTTGQDVILDALNIVVSQPKPTDDVREVLLNASLVNAWFFTKFVAGYNGPFSLMNTGLHLDMLNFLQTYALPKGSRTAIFAPRWHFKTSCGMGFDGWKLVREPELTMCYFHAVVDSAEEFMHVIQRVFDSNPFFAWLFPDYVITRGLKGNNEKKMTLPEVVKKRMTKESTLQCGSVGGTSQGDHFTDITMDDIVGEQDLSAGRSSNVDMYRKANWIPYTERALVTTPNETRIGLRATRYAEDDAYEYITNNMGELICYDDEKRDYDVVKGGEWTVYWRFVKENGKIIFPERVTEEWLAKVEQTDPWFYWTQLENRPRKSGLNKFSSYTPRPFELIYDDDKGWILRYEDEYGVQITNPLGACDMVQAADPAATDTGITARTSRTATGCVAHAPDNKRFVFRVKAGYITPSVMYDELFENAGSFNNYLRASYLEAQGAFKVLVPPLREEERKRRRYLNLRPVSAVGNKDVRIENALDPVLRDNLLYVCTTDGSMDLFKEEYRGFPQAHKKDVLDMISLGLSSTVRPYSEDEELKKAEQYERFMTRSVNRAGY